MAEADTTEAETELYSSDDEEFVIVFENLTVRDVRDGKVLCALVACTFVNHS